jgi:hypothetical protein
MNMDKKEIMSLLNINEETFENCKKKIPEIGGWYYWNPVRGGLSIIINDKNEKLIATSAVSFDEHLSAFKKGKRN